MNANDTLRQHAGGTDHYYKYMLGLLLTDGAKALADNYKCYWLLDIICSYQPELKGEGFQTWTLKKLEDSSAIVTCDDGNGKVLKKQAIEFTDFDADAATLWVENNVIMLPCER